MKILVTGGAGFVGSKLALSLKSNYPSYEIVCFDNLKRRGSELNLTYLRESDISFVHGDIRNKEDFDSLENDFDFIIEASAEPSVLAGMDGTPDYVINTNLVGTINCLAFAKKSNSKFLFLSTSRIYPIELLNKISFEEGEDRFNISSNQILPGVSEKGIAENFPLEGPRSFYGTSKLASELIIQEYVNFYNLDAVINRCGVITGPGQMGKVDQGVVVLWIARHFWHGSLGYFGYGGEGKQLRDLLHIDDLYDLVDYQMHNLDAVKGQIFNVGGGLGCSASLKELTNICETVTGNKIDIKQVKEDRIADIRIYVTDNSKIHSVSNWAPKRNTTDIVSDIYYWMKENERSLKPILK